jgi:hypothetical protein
MSEANAKINEDKVKDSSTDVEAENTGSRPIFSIIHKISELSIHMIYLESDEFTLRTEVNDETYTGKAKLSMLGKRTEEFLKKYLSLCGDDVKTEVTHEKITIVLPYILDSKTETVELLVVQIPEKERLLKTIHKQSKEIENLRAELKRARDFWEHEELEWIEIGQAYLKISSESLRNTLRDWLVNNVERILTKSNLSENILYQMKTSKSYEEALSVLTTAMGQTMNPSLVLVFNLLQSEGYIITKMTSPGFNDDTNPNSAISTKKSEGSWNKFRDRGIAESYLVSVMRANGDWMLPQKGQHVLEGSLLIEFKKSQAYQMKSFTMSTKSAGTRLDYGGKLTKSFLIDCVSGQTRSKVHIQINLAPL